MDEKEIHSADGYSYIQKVEYGWGVWWKGNRLKAWTVINKNKTEWVPIVYGTREQARTAIRKLKQTAL